MEWLSGVFGLEFLVFAGKDREIKLQTKKAIQMTFPSHPLNTCTLPEAVSRDGFLFQSKPICYTQMDVHTSINQSVPDG